MGRGGVGGWHWIWKIVRTPWKLHATPLQGVNSLYTDDVLFFFSFFSKTSASSRGARERNLFSSSPTTTPLRWRSINKSPAVYILSPAPDGLWRENRGSVTRLGSQLLQAFNLTMFPKPIFFSSGTRESLEKTWSHFFNFYFKNSSLGISPSNPSRTSEPRQPRPRLSPRPTNRQNPTKNPLKWHLLQLLVSSPSREVVLTRRFRTDWSI